MTKQVFCDYANSMNNRSTIFAGGSVELVSGEILKHVKSLDFDTELDTLTIYYYDLANRFLIQKGFQRWVKDKHSVVDYPFPTRAKIVTRTSIKKVYFPYKYKQLELF